jgi:Ca2+-binding RTX toxin-like protein
VIENVYGGDGNDRLIGNDADNQIHGGHGADTMIGGAGNDTYFVDNESDTVIENSDGGVDTVDASISYTLGANVENLVLADKGGAIDGTGNAADNVITGNASANLLLGEAGDDTLDGGGGADTLIGGPGNDTYYVDNIGDVVTEKAAEGTDTVIASIDYVLPPNVENLTLAEGAGPLNGVGNDLDNLIVGNSQDNVLDGRIGADRLQGGAGDDIYLVHDARATIVEAVDGGTDTVIATVDYELPANVETLILVGTATYGAVLTTGHSFAAASVELAQTDAAASDEVLGKTLVANSAMASELVGGTGDDFLVGAHVVATDMAGGPGNDGYVIFNSSDIVQEDVGAGSDTIYARTDYVLPENVETLYLLGGATEAWGNNSGSVLVANTLVSSTLHGGEGADLLVGAHDVASTLMGGAGNDVYVVSNSHDLIQENANGGDDTVYAQADYVLPSNVETLYLVGTATHATANDDGVTLIANAALSSVLDGGAGIDLLIGSHGAPSVMKGGAGDDTYIVFNPQDLVTENGSGGNDTVYASVDYVLTDNVETLYLVGSATKATASEQGSTLVGNASMDSTLIGGTGDDLLVGTHSTATTMVAGAGNDALVTFNNADVLTGGAGEDTFVFHHEGTQGATVSDFTSSVDHLVFFGYGTAADGANLTQVDATHWSVNSAGGLVHDLVEFSNAATIHAYDYMFA